MTKGKMSIGAAMKNRMQAADQVGRQEVQAQSLPDPQNEVNPAEELTAFNTRLPSGLQRRLKVYTASQGVKIQDVVQQALEDYLSKQES